MSSPVEKEICHFQWTYGTRYAGVHPNGAILAASLARSATAQDMHGFKHFTRKLCTVAPSRYRKYATVSLCILMLSNAWSSTVYAAQAHVEWSTQSQTELRTILHESGITRLFEDLAANVLAETRQARMDCGDTPAKADKIQQFIHRTLNVDRLMDASIAQLSHSFDQSMIDKVADWMGSDTGQLIQQAEVNSADWSVEEFARRELALASDPNWNDARKIRILRVLDTTGTVEFVTALHSETSALILQSGDCIASEVSRAELNKRIQQANDDESFYSVFLRNDIHTTAAMIFTDISDADLDSFVEFNQSAAGLAWNEALLIMIRQVLRDRHAPMQQFLAGVSHEYE